jgi:acetate kinase
MGSERLYWHIERCATAYSTALVSHYAWFLAILFVRFTAGVGENFSVVRSSACSKMEYLGLRLNEERNAKPIPEEDFAARTRLRCLRCRIASSLISAFGHVEDQ